MQLHPALSHHFNTLRFLILLLLVVALVVVPPPIDASLEDVCAPNVLIIRFDPGMVSFPPEIDQGHSSFILPLDDAQFTLQELEATFSQFRAITFETVAPIWRNITDAERHDRHGNRIDLVDFTNVYRVTFDVDQLLDIGIIAAAIRDVPGITYAECDELGDLFFTPDDDSFPKQWNLNNTEQTWPGAECDSLYDINMPEAWDIWDSAGTKIGICDGAVSADHEDVGPYVDAPMSRSYVDGVGWDGPGHGSKVASIAAAGGNNGVGIAGVANLLQDSLIVALRIKDGSMGDTDSSMSSRAASALAYVCSTGVYPRILVVNHSWGIPRYKGCYTYNATLRDAFRNAFMMDINLVCGAGNGPACGAQSTCADADTCFAYPAAFEDYSLAVTGIDCGGNLLDYRNEGSYIDLTAPGEDIHIAVGDDDEYDIGLYGTSLATPHVSGAIALLLGRDSSLTNEDCYQLLEVTASKLDNYDPIQGGHGLIKVDGALAAITYPAAIVRDSVFAYTADSIDAREQWFMNVNSLGMKDETWKKFWVEVYKLEKVAFLWDMAYAAIDTVWTRGRMSTGWKDIPPIVIDQEAVYKYDARFHANYSEVAGWVPGTSKATFRTYAYKVFDEEGGDFLRWLPEDPQNGFRIDYSVLVRFLVQGGGGKSVVIPVKPILDFGPERSPATDEAALRLGLQRPGSYTLSIHDVTGRRVRTILKDARLESGRHRLVWDGRDSHGQRVASGVYFARLRETRSPAEDHVRTARVVFLR